MKSTSMRFEERIRSRLWLLLVPMAVVYPALAIGALIARPEGWQVLAVAFLAVTPLLLWAMFEFRSLHTRVTDGDVRIGWRWAARTLPRSAVRAARAVKYDWWHYGGWGWRHNFFSGKTAYSVMLPRAVEIEYADRNGRVRTVCVSSRDPERLAEAIGGR